MELKKFKFISDDKIIEWAKSKDFDISKYLCEHKMQVEEMVRWVKENRFNRGSFYNEFLKGTYRDPDSYAIRNIAGYNCLADGLHSLFRIACDNFNHPPYESTNDVIDVYERYRKVPIFYFPPKKDGHIGINVGRSLWKGQEIDSDKDFFTYHDRIDLFLFDLKMWFKYYFEEENEYNARKICKMHKYYLDEVTETKKWLVDLQKEAIEKKYRNGFEYLMNEIYDVKNIFVDDEYEVFNIETGELITEQNWCDVKNGDWTTDFYENLKIKIDEWYNKQGLLCG